MEEKYPKPNINVFFIIQKLVNFFLDFVFTQK